MLQMEHRDTHSHAHKGHFVDLGHTRTQHPTRFSPFHSDCCKMAERKQRPYHRAGVGVRCAQEHSENDRRVYGDIYRNTDEVGLCEFS